MRDATTIALFVVGYPVSIWVIARWLPVVREQRHRWFFAHEVAVAAIVSGWALLGAWFVVAVNAAWLVAAAVWYARHARRAT